MSTATKLSLIGTPAATFSGTLGPSPSPPPGSTSGGATRLGLFGVPTRNFFSTGTVPESGFTTKDRRASVSNVLKPYRPRVIFPDGSFNNGDRAQIAMAYRGLFDSEGPSPGPPPDENNAKWWYTHFILGH